MHITSTINPSTKSSGDLPVLLVCYQDRKVFLRKERGYQSMISLICSRFGIEGHSSTSESAKSGATPPLANGAPFKITSPIMPSQVPSGSISTAVGTLWLGLNNAAGSCSNLSISGSSTANSTTAQSISSQKQQACSPRIRIQTCSLDVCRGDFVEIDETVYESMWEVLDEVFVLGDSDVQIGKSKSGLERTASTGSNSCGGSWAAVGIPTEGENGVDSVLPSPAPSPGPLEARPHEALLESNTMLVGPSAPISRHMNSSSRTRRSKANQADVTSSVALSAAAKPPPQSKRTLPITPSTPSRRAGCSGTPGEVLTPRATQPQASTSRSTAPTQDQEQPDAQEGDEPRFKIHVSGPFPGQRADFMAKGKHTGRKILATVCQNFQLDLTRARLFHLVKEDTVGSGRAVRQVECDPRMTMTDAGVHNRSKLMITLDPTEEEVEELEEGEEGDEDEGYGDGEEEVCNATGTEAEVGSQETDAVHGQTGNGRRNSKSWR